MKSIYIVLFLALFSFALTKKFNHKHRAKHHLHKKHHSPWPAGKPLPTTPKGEYLSDHYGARIESNPYGP